MTVDIEYQSDTKLNIQYKVLINKVVSAALEYEGCPCDVAVNILLTDDDEIKELNTEYRGINKTTDVLSFPMIDWKKPANYKELTDDLFDPFTGELILGDIAISVQKIISQSEEYGHSKRRELGFLVAHSMLHLLGYDHMNNEERLIMEAKQREILCGLGINR